jgi:4-diphosphocytidyl-2-C-methyl-D-erythritol kinase
MRSAPAYAKINLALVVGPRRDDGKHEVVTVLQQVDLRDTVSLTPADDLVVEGFESDTIVRDALKRLGDAAGVAPLWRIQIEKRVPVAAGLGGGSSDAAAALRLVNDSLADPLSEDQLHGIAAATGADVPFFLRGGIQLGTGDGSELAPLSLPTEYAVLLVVPHGEAKASTREVYEAFEGRGGSAGFASRVARLRDQLAAVSRPGDLARLPPNDLASSPLARELGDTGSFRADVSGAGPTLYGLFEDETAATAAAARLASEGTTIVTRPMAAGDRP